MEQSRSALHQAEILSEAGEWGGAVNRGYYAIFYAALALLVSRGLGASKHSAVLSLVDREFVKPGLMAPEFSLAFRDAFNARQNSDYREFKPATQLQARVPCVGPVRRIDEPRPGVGGRIQEMSTFVDTSAIYAVLDRDDESHASALPVWEELVSGDEALMVTNHVQLEVVALVQHRLGMRAVADFFDSSGPWARAPAAPRISTRAPHPPAPAGPHRPSHPGCDPALDIPMPPC